MPATILLAVIAVCVTAALCVRWALASRERCLAAHRAERAELYQRIQAPGVAISDHAVATGPQATVAAVEFDSDEDYWKARESA